ncbi:hypothetical protein, partial [uncultured Nocardioides sp.]|uniref:hypothetical protein n=1 Tax=uncultured Nocardioides sp. TaxID=198441 RepID=UPI00260F5EC0
MTSSSLAPRPIDRDASGDPSRRRPRSRHRRLSVPAAVLLGVPLLAACGADDTAAVDPAAAAKPVAEQMTTEIPANVEAGLAANQAATQEIMLPEV